jgi:tetratricopeptide (TPR) repeat protein
MSSQQPKQNISPSSLTSSDTTAPRQQIISDVLLVWMDPRLDQSNKDCQNTVAQLKTVVNNVHMFTQRDESIDFLTDLKNTTVFMIIEGGLCQEILPLIHDIPQLENIYILCRNTHKHEEWTKTRKKMKGVHTEITPICESIQQALKQINQDSIAVSFIPAFEEISHPDLNRLEPSFMYTQIFKDILLKIKYNKQSIKDFISYCRDGNYGSPSNITRFENEYNTDKAIWWYTYPSFLYSLLNSALRMLEAKAIIKIGFFLRDLHHQIAELHRKQGGSYHTKPFTVYRGQGLSTTDFEKFCKTKKGGLISFNNFLSTSTDREVSLEFAQTALIKPDTVGILFQMFVNPAVSSIPFAAIREMSFFNAEEEILFSMHTVFRIGDITQIDSNNSLYQVDLELTADDDQQLRVLTDHIRKETGSGTGWDNLGILLLRIGQFDMAEELYNVLLEQTSDETNTAAYYNNLGSVACSHGDYEKAIGYYEKALEIQKIALPPNHPSLAASYNNIGGVYYNVGEYSKALSSYERSLKIQKRALHPNHPALATTYNNIGEVYRNMGEYSKALSSYERSLEIRKIALPPNHPDMATSYHNIGSVYNNMGEYSKALSSYERSLEIDKVALPPNHPDLATSYSNIGRVYYHMCEYSKALSLYERSLEIMKIALPPNHPDLATSYSNIGAVYDNIGEYSKALSCYEKAQVINHKSLPPNHPHIAITKNNIEIVRKKL